MSPPPLNLIVDIRLLRMLCMLGLMSEELRKKFIGQTTLPDASLSACAGYPLPQSSIITALPVALKRTE